MTEQQFSEIRGLAIDRAKNDLLSCAGWFRPDFIWGGFHREVADHLQEAAVLGDKYLMVVLPPRTSKSTLCSRILPAFFLGHFPKKEVMIVAHSQPFASEFGQDVKDIINDESYSEIFPGISISQESSARDNWRTTTGGQFHAFGRKSANMGRGADLLIIDDLIKGERDADSSASLQEVYSCWRDLTTRIQNDANRKGSVVIVNTRWSCRDLIGVLQEEGQYPWKILHYPAVNKDDTTLWPEMYDYNYYKPRMVNRRYFSAVYQGQPTPDEGYIFNRDYFKYYSGSFVPGQNIVRDGVSVSVNYYMTSDYAKTESSENERDYTVHCVWAVDDQHNIYLADMWRDQTIPLTWIDAWLDLAEFWKPTHSFEEAGTILGNAKPYLIQKARERKITVMSQEISPDRPKDKRTWSIQAMLQDGRVFLPKDANWLEDVEAELLNFPTGKNDDIVDNFSLIGLVVYALQNGMVFTGEKKKTSDLQVFENRLKMTEAKRKVYDRNQKILERSRR